MKTEDTEIDFAIEVFLSGHSAGKSRTFPYEASRVGPLWDIVGGVRSMSASEHY
jgi:hypothetical protein